MMNRRLTVKNPAVFAIITFIAVIGVSFMLVFNAVAESIKTADEAEQISGETAEETQAETENSEETVYKTAQVKLADAADAVYDETDSEDYSDNIIVCTAEKTTIYSEADENSDTAGVLTEYGTAACISENDGWIYLKSGDVTGYASSDDFARDEEAEDLEDERVSVQTVLVSDEAVNFREEGSTDAEVLCVIPEGSVLTLLGEDDDEWIAAEVEGVGAGYIASEYAQIQTGERYAISEAEIEANINGIQVAAQMKEDLAEEAARIAAGEDTESYGEEYSDEYEEDSATADESYSDDTYEDDTYYGEDTSDYDDWYEEDTSDYDDRDEETTETYYEEETEETSYYDSAQATRQALVNYACSFAGWLPYVSGGHSLVTGADCSGFTAAVYAAFGYTLPYSSEAQKYVGYSVPLSQILPGDLLIYSGHVAIYVGDGLKVHSPYPGATVTVNSMYYATILDVRRIIG